ncbi:hypothetical protein RN001_009113 [Aquatica leii]|uniref:MADF domain-containing protein n=1 Tax=Aquatica leii TaxID=1421715 RepID=A0AAN7PV17_9COLE|nr:hypothetical protein RN001_009113 [Aquatica leii]
MQEIMAIEGFGVIEIKNKIRALRSTYLQELKKIKDSKKSGAGADSVYVPHVKWFADMHSFLQCLDNKRPTQDNLIVIFSKATKQATATTSTFQAPSLSKRKKSNMQQVSAVLRNLKYIANEVSKEPSLNQFVIFGNSVAAQLQNLTIVNALLTQEQIQSLLTKFRIRELQSVSATAPPPRINAVMALHHRLPRPLHHM